MICHSIFFYSLGWNELLIAGFAHRSVNIKDGILLATGLHVHRATAHQAGVGTIFDRVLTELVAKMREMKMDKSELGALRAIVLFNPGMRESVDLAQTGVNKNFVTYSNFLKPGFWLAGSTAASQSEARF